MAVVFTDRKSTYPNRYKVTTDSGESYYVTLERADVPTVAGTPLNAETLNALVNSVSAVGHKHSGSDITSGTVAIARGGTGATTAAAALTNLGAAPASHNHSASNITSGTLPIERGGTGATTASAALTSLGAAPASHNHDASQVVSGTLGIARGGTGSSNGATGLHNLFAAGDTVLSSYQFGNELPDPGVPGRIFFRKVE